MRHLKGILQAATDAIRLKSIMPKQYGLSGLQLLGTFTVDELEIDRFRESDFKLR